jgi:DUF4097 and DUF4098 domain-containing protein YvlB
MGRQTFETEGVPTLSVVECLGSLKVQGGPGSAVRLSAESSDLEVGQEGDTIMATCSSDLQVELPYDASIQVQKVAGDMAVKHISGSSTLGIVDGDLSLSQVGPATVEMVSGDLSGRVVGGDLVVGDVSGDMSVRNVTGRLEVGRVGRDLGVRDIQGDASAEDVRSDIRLRTDFAPGKEYRFRAKGDIVVRVPASADAHFTLRSGGGDIRIKAPLEDRVEEEGQVTGRLGDGGASVVLEAGKDIVLVARDGEWGEFGAGMGVLGAEIGAEFGAEFAGLAEEIAAQVEAQVEEMSAQLEHKLAHLEVELAGMDRRAAEAAERAAEQARKQVERAAERVRRRAEKEAARARRQAERARWKVGRPVAPRPPRPPKPPVPEPAGEPVSDQERLTILNMVAEGKITIEEAETLLEALNA